MKALRIGQLACLVLALGGCAANTSEEGAEGAQGAQACNALANTAAAIDEMAVAEDMPVGAVGGEIAEGTYHLTSRITYVGTGGMSGSLGHTRKQTVVITRAGEGNYDLDSVLSDDGEPDEHASLTAMSNGSIVRVDVTCPTQTLLGTTHYTATPTSYTTYDVEVGRIQVYTRVP